MELPALALQACMATPWAASADLVLRLPVIAALMLLAGWVGAQRWFPGQGAFVGLHGAMVLWLLVSGLERAAQAEACKVTLALLAWPAIMAAPALWALFLDRHVHSRYGRVPAWQWALLGLPALALVALAWLNHRHGLMYGPATGMDGGGAAAGGAPVMRYAHGPLFFAAAGWNYVLLLAASAQLALAALRTQGAQRRVWLGFLLIAAVPWAANIAYIGFGLQLLGADPTPLSFAVSVAGFAWLIRSRQLFDIVPLARGLLFSELPDAVLIVDRDGRVMECNAAARSLAGQRLPPGQPLAEWPRFGAALAAHLAQGSMGTLALGDRIFELRVRAIGPAQRQIGRLLQLRDVTEYHRAQVRVVHTLAERNAQLQKVAALQAELH
jgi:PAS domain-containing protein